MVFNNQMETEEMKWLKRDRKFLSELSARLSRRSFWLNGVKSVRSGMGYFNRVPLILIGRFRQTDSLAVFAFLNAILACRRSQGNQGLALWLKANQVVLMNYLAGGRPSSCLVSPKVSVTRTGLPRVIPSNHRKVIRLRLSGWHLYARLWMSLFGFYRVIDFRGRVKISTIIRPSVPFSLSRYYQWMQKFIDLIFQGDKLLYRWKPLLILKSAPGVTEKFGLAYSVAAASRQAWSILRIKEVWQPLYDLAKRLGASFSMIPKLESAAKAWDRERADVRPFLLGKLGFKDEPGKVRVFAMVDWWTQTLLYPLHQWIIGHLSRLPMDSTLDQDAGVDRASFSVRLSHFGGSYDLSAATDRLPVVLQEALMDTLLPGSGSSWKDVLVGRAYAMGSRKSVRYSVGQPMGAYSSWAMLALTHHFLVQVAAWEIGVSVQSGNPTLYTGYQVLGDDIVIFNDRVANRYLEIMADLGVEISFAKSIVSKDTIEFAKRFVSGGRDLSPLAFKELDVAMASLDAMALLIQKFRGELPVALLARLRGAGYRARSTIYSRLNRLSVHMRNLVVWATMPGLTSYSWKTYREWIGMRSLRESRPDLLDMSELNKMLLEMISSLTSDGWRPDGPHTTIENGEVSFKHFPGLRMSSAAYITDLQNEITDKAMNLLREVHAYQDGFRTEIKWWTDPRYPEMTANEIIHSHFEKSMSELLVLEQRIAAMQKGVVMNSRKEFSTPLFSGKWLRLWHRFSAVKSLSTGPGCYKPDNQLP